MRGELLEEHGLVGEDVGRIAVEVVEREEVVGRGSTAGRRTGTRARRRPPRCSAAARAISSTRFVAREPLLLARAGSRRRSGYQIAPENWRSCASNGPRARSASRSPGRASFWLSTRAVPSSSTIAESPSGPSAGEVIARIVTPRPSRSSALAVRRADEVVEAERRELRVRAGRCRTRGAAPAPACSRCARATRDRSDRGGGARCRGSRASPSVGGVEPVVAREREPRAEVRGREPRVAQHRAVAGLHETAGVTEERDAHRRSFSRAASRARRTRPRADHVRVIDARARACERASTARESVANGLSHARCSERYDRTLKDRPPLDPRTRAPSFATGLVVIRAICSVGVSARVERRRVGSQSGRNGKPLAPWSARTASTWWICVRPVLEVHRRRGHVEPPHARAARADLGDRVGPRVARGCAPTRAASARSARAAPRRGAPRSRRCWMRDTTLPTSCSSPSGNT